MHAYSPHDLLVRYFLLNALIQSSPSPHHTLTPLVTMLPLLHAWCTLIPARRHQLGRHVDTQLRLMLVAAVLAVALLHSSSLAAVIPSVREMFKAMTTCCGSGGIPLCASELTLAHPFSAYAVLDQRHRRLCHPRDIGETSFQPLCKRSHKGALLRHLRISGA